MKATGGTRARAVPENRERLKEYGQTRADSDWNDLAGVSPGFEQSGIVLRMP